MGKRGPQRQFSEDHLLDAALEIVNEHGLGGLSMSALARNLSVSVSGLYRYVDDISALFAGLQRRAVLRYQQELEAELANFGKQVRARRPRNAKVRALAKVLVGFRYYLVHQQDFPSEHRLLDAFLSEPDPLLSEEDAITIGQEVDAILSICGSTLDEAVVCEAVTVGDTEVRTHLIWAALHGLMHFAKRDRIQPPRLAAEALVTPLLTSLLVGFGASQAEIKKAFTLLDALADQSGQNPTRRDAVLAG